MTREKFVAGAKALNAHPSRNKFERLYDDARRRKARETRQAKTLADGECTFVPNMELTQEFNTSELGRRKRVDRDRSNGRETRSRPQEVDAQTGQALFTPAIGRLSKNRPKSRGESIGDYLYSYRGRNHSGRSSSMGKDQGLVRSSSSCAHDRSSQLVERLRTDCFRSVFAILDSDSDGIIGSASINVAGNSCLVDHTVGLPQGICEMYLPVLKEMEEMKCTLTLTEFLDASTNLYKDLSITQRNELVVFHKSLAGNRSSRTLSCEPYSFRVLVFSERDVSSRR